MPDNSNETVALTVDEKSLLIEKEATCPFIGSVVAEGKLAVINSAKDPLASVEEVRKLGNAGGGDLGDLLVVFANGNHAFMRGDTGKLDRQVPGGLFSLEFPGSQGAHQGHSGILMGDPEMLASGRLSLADFGRLATRAMDGLIKRSDVARFIAENLSNDAKSKVFGSNVATLLGGDLVAFAETIGPALASELEGLDQDTSAAHRTLEEKLTRLTGEDNLIGSAGEFGLLFAFLANKPGARDIDGEPAVSVDDLNAMFVEKQLPEGSENWKKLRIDWVKNTIWLAVRAAKEYAVIR